MIQCIIADSHAPTRNLLEGYIRRIPFLQLTHRCESALEANDILKQPDAPNLVFLATKLPDMPGLQFLQTIVDKPLAILISDNKDNAFDAFEQDVVDFLLKPVAFNRFLKACNKAHELYTVKSKFFSRQYLIPSDFFFVNVEYNQVKIKNDEIVFIEAMKDYIRIHFTNNKPVLTRMSMKAMEERLPYGQFARIHKSYIVSISKITTIKRGLVVLGPHEIPLSDNFKSHLDSMLGLLPD